MTGTDQRRGSPDDGRRMTKAERREEARLKREEIQRSMATRKRNRRIGLVLVVVAVIIAIVAVFMTSGGDEPSASGIPSAETLLAQADAAATTAGCDAVQQTPNYADAPGDDPAIDHAHIGTAPVTSPPALSTYPTIPPASGPHASSPLPAGVYDSPPDVYSTMHSLEHGAVIIWYSPEATGKQLDDLIAFYGQPVADPDIGQAKIIIAPYDYPEQGAAGQLPAGRADGGRRVAPAPDLHRREPARRVRLLLEVRGPRVRRTGVRGRSARAGGADLADGSQEEAEAAPTPRELVVVVTTTTSGGTASQRQERKELARQAKEAARKRAQRSARVRRITTFLVAGAVGVGIVWFFQRAASPRAVSDAAIAAAEAAGCSEVQTPTASAPGGVHLQPGQSHVYPDQPPTSGPHDPSPLPIPPRVYTEPINDANAVHNLEHGAVIMYYRHTGDDALPQDVVDRLVTIANEGHNTILAPYSPLPEGTALALTAWNKLQTCPATTTSAQAATIANGFIDAFLCTSNAPEGNLGEGC